jgi:hypothetical protein
VPHIPQDFGTPEQAGPDSAAPPEAEVDAKVENFLWSFVEPHRGQGVPSQLVERTNTSLSASHASQ